MARQEYHAIGTASAYARDITAVQPVNDGHCHYFSPGFFTALGREATPGSSDPSAIPGRLGWDAPPSDEGLADRWVAELDRNGVSRVMLIASVPGDEASVALAVRRHPSRLAGAFMLDPSAPDAADRVVRAFGEPGMRAVCLFPAMHGVPVTDERSQLVFEAAARHRRTVFVHCGLLTIGIRTKLGLASRFDLRLGDPLAVAAMAVRFPEVPVIIPHFGAGLFREALMAAVAAPNIVLDTSSTNGWIKLHHGLALADVFARALDCVGSGRLLFGTDSSFFPRGWHRAIYDVQKQALDAIGVDGSDQGRIFGGNFRRVVMREADGTPPD
jgi:predicted TIM-barrel fold metal-dependent hydrolase